MALTDMVNGAYGNMAMVNYPYPANLLGPMPAYPVKEVCSYFKGFTDKSTNEQIWNATYYGTQIFYNYMNHNKEKCLDIKPFLPSDGPETEDFQGWDYMACNEMIMPENQNGVTDMFLPLYYDPQSDAADCLKKKQIVSQPSWCLDYYGGRNPKVDFAGATNIIFSNGSLDPWHAGGVLDKTAFDYDKTGVKIIWIDNSAHHFDLRGDNHDDPKSVSDARAEEISAIERYIKEYNDNKKN